MAPTIAIRLPATVIFTVIIPGLPNFNITDTDPSVIQSPLQRQLATLPDGYVAHPDVGAAYKIYNETVPWKEAKKRCISEGAHLVVIDNFLKFEYLMIQSNADRIWTGIYRIQNDTEWVSDTTGSTITNLPWAPREPDGPYDCVRADRSHRGLENYDCGYTHPYVCELPIPENYNARGIGEMTEITAN